MVLSSSWCTILLVPFLRLIIGAPTTGIDVTVVDPQQTGCLYDNKLFSENQVIPTKEPCLMCSCQQKKISCQLQVCPYIDEGSLYPPPAGCILVERKGACCPKLHCPTSNPGGNRLLRKDPTGQITAWKARDALRKRLVKQLTKNGTEKIGCVEGGTLYAEGSAMMTSSTCEYCFCLKGKQNCVKPRCAVAKPMEGCTPRFQKELACCPTHYVCDNSTEVLKNTTAAFTKKIALVGNRHLPSVVSRRIPQAENDRIIDSSRNNEFKSQEILNNHDKKKVVKRETETTNGTSTSAVQNVDEVIISTQGSESPIVSTPSSMIETATAVDEKTLLVERTANDLNQDTTEPQGDHYPNSTTAKESSMDDSAPAASSSETAMPAMVTTSTADTTSFTETPTSKSDDVRMLISSTTEHEEEEESSSTFPEDESTDSLINLTSQRRADDVEQQLGHDEENEEAEAAERAIEVSVSSSISSVSFSKTDGHTNHTIGDTSKNATPTSNFFPINSKAPASGAVKPLVPAPVKNVDHDDYDYDNMELPPSLPNLEIIPFVAADAVHGVPSNFDDDERLSLGGLSTNQQLASPIVPEERNDTSDVSEDPNTNSDESNSKTKPESETSLPSQTATPIGLQAFKVTFPPRSSSTLRSTSPSVFLNRFTLKRTTTQRTTVTPTTRSKLNKPTVNNLVGSSSVGLTGGLRIDGCNIYGQMYRVGRIIDELSGPCIECKCTEIGVNCTNLKC